MEDLVEEVENTGICMDSGLWIEVKRRFELVEGNSNKFYEIMIEDCGDGTYRLRKTYGRIGSKGVENTSLYSFLGSAENEFRDTMNTRLQHGYVEVEAQ